jgi:branched-chain amino acid transport system substrate-binding protein
VSTVNRSKRRAAIVLALLLALAACGTRESDDSFDDGQNGDNGDNVDTGDNEASDVGITPDTIKIGNIAAENGILGDAFAPAVWGIRAWAEAINAEGGIAGRDVELITCDDREDRIRALECAQKLVEEDEVFALLATNTRAMGGASEYLADSGIPIIGFPITNAFNRFPNFYSAYGSGYVRNGAAVGNDGDLMFSTGAYRWFKNELGVTKAAVFFYDIDESRQAGEGFATGLELEGFEVERYVISFAAPNFAQPVADMQRRGTEIVFDGMDDGGNRRLCDAMASGGFTPEAKVSTVVAFGDAVRDRYNDTCRNAIFITGDSRPYTNTDVAAIAEFREAYEEYQPGKALHQWALEAWAIGTMFRDVMEELGTAPTREGLMDGLDELVDYQADGILTGIDYQDVDFTQETIEDCFTIGRWLDDEGGWVEATTEFPTCDAEAKLYSTPALEQGN